MRGMTAILAHGALGPFDEIIFLAIAVVFLGMMGVSWLRSNQLPDEDFGEADDAAPPDRERFELE